MRIIENKDTGEIIIGDLRIEGFILEGRCTVCNNFLINYEKYDSSFCAYCNEWTEASCADSDCEYCKDKPEKPL